MKVQTKKWIRLSVILYIAILAFATVFTLAWFVFDETAIIKTKDNMKITAGSKLEIAVVRSMSKIPSDIRLSSESIPVSPSEDKLLQCVSFTVILPVVTSSFMSLVHFTESIDILPVVVESSKLSVVIFLTRMAPVVV